VRFSNKPKQCGSPVSQEEDDHQPASPVGFDILKLVTWRCVEPIVAHGHSQNSPRVRQHFAAEIGERGHLARRNAWLPHFELPNEARGASTSVDLQLDSGGDRRTSISVVPTRRLKGGREADFVHMTDASGTAHIEGPLASRVRWGAKLPLNEGVLQLQLPVGTLGAARPCAWSGRQD